MKWWKNNDTYNLASCAGRRGIAAAISVMGSAGLASIASSIPVLGWVVGIVGVGYLTIQGKEFAESICGALQKGKGVDISLGWYYFVPRFKFTVC